MSQSPLYHHPARLITLIVSGLGFLSGPVIAVDLEARFNERVLPFMQNYCHACHGGEKTEADFDLVASGSLAAVVENLPMWDLVREQIEDGAMPPRKAKHHPSPEEGEEVLAWLRDLRKDVAEKNAGDPGPVLARRLSNAEYDYTIRDLTGVDIRPAREFPVDPANEAGFDNTGESLTMSPALLNKYLEAARRVADHLVLTPVGFAFAEHPVIAETDRDKYGVRKIIEFYQRQPTELADYFAAVWKYQQRLKAGGAEISLAALADEARLSSKYLQTLVDAFAADEAGFGPIAALQAMLAELPDDAAEERVRESARQMSDLVQVLREQVKVDVPNLSVKGMNNGAQPLVLWRNRRMAESRRSYGGGALEIGVAKQFRESRAAAALAVPDDGPGRERYEEAFRRFCDIFPDAFYISERGRLYLENGEDKGNTGRFLSAGLHNQMGYFRDDRALYELILDDAGQLELDHLWDAFLFSSDVPARMHSGHIWHERAESGFIRGAEFEFARPEDRDVVVEPKFSRFAELYLGRVREASSDETTIKAVADYFAISAAAIREVEDAWQTCEPRHLEALQVFARRAWRRPLSDGERDGIVTFYKLLRNEGKLSHEDAVRDSLASLLMSPHFCYRADPAGVVADSGAAVRPLAGYELANRLSYFLWSSMPDQALLDSAASGDLAQSEVLLGQVRRMLQDGKVRGFATEFAGNWLDFRRFEEHNAVDRQRFPGFDAGLRQAMFEEPVRLFEDLAMNDRPVGDFLFASDTFVNGPLAKHYGMPVPENPEDWVRIEDADRYGRGGLLPMAVFLTRSAPGLRTSPVKRGYWVVRRLLGEHIPAPPPDVPELPDDESAAGTLSLRQALEKHREDPNCSACHARFDAFGLVFEGYGPVGEIRSLDLGGRPVETHAEFPGGGEGAGLDDLKQYLEDRRLDDFVANLCRKMLSYALGRGLIPSDDATLAEMRARLAAGDDRFSCMIETIVTSPQFLNKRLSTATAAH